MARRVICYTSSLFYCPSYLTQLTVRHAHMIRLQGKLCRVPFARKILVVGKMVSIWFKLGAYCVISIKYAKRSRYLFHAVAWEKATWNSIFRVENVQLYQTILHCNTITLLFMKGHSGTAKMWSLHMKLTELSYLTGLVKTISSLVKLWATYLQSSCHCI